MTTVRCSTLPKIEILESGGGNTRPHGLPYYLCTELEALAATLCHTQAIAQRLILWVD